MSHQNAAEYLASFHNQLAISRQMEVRREEYLDFITFQANERPLFTEIFGPLLGLKEEWREQGASEAEIDMSAFRYRRPLWGGVPVNTGWQGGDEPVILEETEDILIVRDEMGRRMQLAKKAATLPLPTSSVRNRTLPRRTPAIDGRLPIVERFGLRSIC